MQRRSALRALAVVALAWPAASVGQGRQSDPQAELFVQAQAQRVLAVLGDKTMARPAKAAAFRRMIDQVADVPRITTFVLGKYARTITPAQRQQFNEAFRAYAESVYESRMGGFKGQKLRVTGSVARKPGDVVVSTLVYGGPDGKSTPVGWRVLGGGAAWKVVDVQVGGVWLAITQQQDFVSTIDNAGGDVGVLIAQLQSDARRQRLRGR